MRRRSRRFAAAPVLAQWDVLPLLRDVPDSVAGSTGSRFPGTRSPARAGPCAVSRHGQRAGTQRGPPRQLQPRAPARRGASRKDPDTRAWIDRWDPVGDAIPPERDGCRHLVHAADCGSDQTAVVCEASRARRGADDTAPWGASIFSSADVALARAAPFIAPRTSSLWLSRSTMHDCARLSQACWRQAA